MLARISGRESCLDFLIWRVFGAASYRGFQITMLLSGLPFLCSWQWIETSSSAQQIACPSCEDRQIQAPRWAATVGILVARTACALTIIFNN